MANSVINFDGEPLDLFQSFWDNTRDLQTVRDRQAERDYQLFHAYLDMSNRNPNGANISIPKLYGILLTKAPPEIKATIGQKPYIPFDSEREEFKEQAELSVSLLDGYLRRGSFWFQYVVAGFMKMLYGTSYIELTPKIEDISQKVIKQDTVDTINGKVPVGQPRTERISIPRFRLGIKAFAPWEVRVDPAATNLEHKDGCRGVIKVEVVSRREIIRRAEKGDFGDDFDVDKLKEKQSSGLLDGEGRNRGAEILRAMGYPQQDHDGDLGVQFRYESPERYITVWNDNVLLQDQDNPFAIDKGGHGLINLTRLIHNIDPHTNKSFYGNGEGKINEPMSNLLNDIFGMALDNHAMMGQGKTYYARNRGVSPTQLVHAIGNKIGFDVRDNEDIRKLVVDDYGKPLPAEHYALREIVEGYIDDISKSHPVSQGKTEPGNQTLGEVSFLKEGDEAPIELNVLTLENITLSDVGNKGSSHIEQFTLRDDVVEILGEENANILMFKNPNDLPGGFNHTFKGSDKIVNQVIRQRNVVNAFKEIGDNEFVKQDEKVRVILETHDLDDVVDRILKTPEEVAFEQQQVQTAELAQKTGDPRILNQGAINIKRSQIAQEAGRPPRLT